MDDGGWNTPEVAQAQLELVKHELENPMLVEPYAYFIQAMALIQTGIGKPMSLLDVGCGVGHYAHVCREYFPSITYYGTDASQAMIDEARKFAPFAPFDVAVFGDNVFSAYDIILTGQCIEYTPYPWAALDRLLDRAKKYIILNRVRLTVETSHKHREVTYCGKAGYTYLWNAGELGRHLYVTAYSVSTITWKSGGQATFLIEK